MLLPNLTPPPSLPIADLAAQRLSIQVGIITLDGPAAVGKNKVGLGLAKAYNIDFLDTGIIYRAMGFIAKSFNQSPETLDNQDLMTAMNEGQNTTSDKLLRDIAANFLNTIKIEVSTSGTRVLTSNESTIDLTQQISSEEFGQLGSAIGRFPFIREKLLDLQRSLATQNPRGCVVSGRDAGTVLFPESKCKIFLTASTDARISRSQNRPDDSQHRKDPNLIVSRDKRDTQRPVAPLRPADDAIQLDTSDLSLEDTITNLTSKIDGIVLQTPTFPDLATLHC